MRKFHQRTLDDVPMVVRLISDPVISTTKQPQPPLPPKLAEEKLPKNGAATDKKTSRKGRKNNVDNKKVSGGSGSSGGGGGGGSGGGKNAEPRSPYYSPYLPLVEVNARLALGDADHRSQEISGVVGAAADGDRSQSSSCGSSGDGGGSGIFRTLFVGSLRINARSRNKAFVTAQPLAQPGDPSSSSSLSAPSAAAAAAALPLPPLPGDLFLDGDQDR